MIFWEKQKTITALYEQFTRTVCIEHKQAAKKNTQQNPHEKPWPRGKHI